MERGTSCAVGSRRAMVAGPGAAAGGGAMGSDTAGVVTVRTGDRASPGQEGREGGGGVGAAIGHGLKLCREMTPLMNGVAKVGGTRALATPKWDHHTFPHASPSAPSHPQHPPTARATAGDTRNAVGTGCCHVFSHHHKVVGTAGSQPHHQAGRGGGVRRGQGQTADGCGAGGSVGLQHAQHAVGPCEGATGVARHQHGEAWGEGEWRTRCEKSTTAATLGEPDLLDQRHITPHAIGHAIPRG